MLTAYTGRIYSQVNNFFSFSPVTCERLTHRLGLFLLLFSGISLELCSSLCLRHTCISVTLVPGDMGKRKMEKPAPVAVFQRREVMNLQRRNSFFHSKFSSILLRYIVNPADVTRCRKSSIFSVTHHQQ